MQDISALEQYDAELPDATKVVSERDLKDQAFYTAATVAPSADAIEPMYDQVLDELGRFGQSEMATRLKENWKQERESSAKDILSEIALTPDLPMDQKVNAAKRVTWSIEQEPTEQEIYVKTLGGKPPLEINVVGGEASISSWSPEYPLIEKLADGLMKVKQLANKYEIQDWVPLLGGTGLGDIFVGQSPEMLKDISYEGLKAIVTGSAGSGRLGTLNIDPRMLDTAFVAADALAVAKIGTKAAKNIVQNAVKEATSAPKSLDRVEPTLGTEPLPEVFTHRRGSPADVTSKVNKEAAATLLSRGVKSEKMADAMGTKPSTIVQNNLLPKVDETLKEIYPDIYDQLVEADQKMLHYFDASKVDPYLFDTTAIKGDVAKHYQAMKEASEVAPNMASSYIEDTGRAFRGTMVYGKTANTGFDDIMEVVDTAEMLQRKVASNLGIDPKKVKVKIEENPNNAGEYFIKWDFFKAYDPVKDTFMGYPTISANFVGWDTTAFANNTVGKLIYNPATRMADWLTAGFARATIRATNLEKVWGDVMRNQVLTTGPKQELAQAIYRTEEIAKDLSVPELREMFPTMEAGDFKSLVNGYAHYRRLNEHLYLVINDVYRTQKVTAGMKGMYDSSGRYINNLGRAVPQDPDILQVGEDGLEQVIVKGKKHLIGSDNAVPSEVYSFKMKDGVGPEGKTVKEHVGGVPVEQINIANENIYKLDKPIKKDGKVYEFAMGLQEGKVPEELLPRIPGYYPHINTEHYFIKAIPKQLTINGRKLPARGEKDYDKFAEIYQQHASTVAVARTQKSGDQMASKLAKDNPDFEYFNVFERTEIDDNLATSLDMVKYAQDVAKSRREERLALPDGTLGRLEDPAVALDKRLNQAARMYEWKDIDFEFRQRFLESFGEFTKGVFPKTMDDINLGTAIATSANEQKLTAARNIFEQYAKQQRAKDTFLDPVWRSATLKVGRAMEEVAPKAADVIKELSGKREPLISTALKVATVKYIHLNPIRQWFIQPAQLYELHALALSKGNLKFSRDMANISWKLLAETFIRNNEVVPESIRKMVKEGGHIQSGYSAKEFNEIVDAFYDSGISKAVDLNAVVDGVFRDAGTKLDVTPLQGTASRAWSATKGVGSIPKNVGYNPAEMMNNIGLWLYARSEFIKANPKLKWNDPHNLELIAEKAWGVGNSMPTRADLLPYQEGAARAIMQFMAYTNKAVMQPLNSKYLTKGEKVRLAAIRTSLWGTSGFLGGNLLLEKIKKSYYADAPDDPGQLEEKTWVDETFALAERGLTDLMMNKTLQMMFDGHDPDSPKTDLMVSKSMAPAPEYGLPMGDLVKDTLELLNGEGQVSQKVPLLSAVSSISDTINILWDSLYARKWEQEDTGKTLSYILKTSEFASGYSNFEKGLAMLQYDKLVDKAGNPLDLSTTTAEAIAKFAGVQSFKADAYYTVMKQDVRLKNHIKDTATKIVASLDAIEDIYEPIKQQGGPTSIEEVAKAAGNQVDRVNHLVALYAQDGVNLDDELRKEVWRQIEMRERAGLQSLVGRIHNRASYKYDNARKEMVKRLQQMSETGNKEMADMISNLFTEVENPYGAKE